MSFELLPLVIPMAGPSRATWGMTQASPPPHVFSLRECSLQAHLALTLVITSCKLLLISASSSPLPGPFFCLATPYFRHKYLLLPPYLQEKRKHSGDRAGAVVHSPGYTLRSALWSINSWASSPEIPFPFFRASELLKLARRFWSGGHLTVS